MPFFWNTNIGTRVPSFDANQTCFTSKSSPANGTLARQSGAAARLATLALSVMRGVVNDEKPM